MKKVIDLRKMDLLKNGFVGILWIIVGVAQILKPNPTIINASVWGVLIIDFIFELMPQFVKTEVEDEMAEHNKQKAISNTFFILYVFISFFMIMSAGGGDWMVNLKLILPFLVGGMSILRFGFFIFYEKVGDQ